MYSTENEPLMGQYKKFAVEYNQFRVAGVVAVVFKVAAWIVLLVSAYAFVYVRNHYADSWREQLAIASGAVFLASSLAFFA
jgi:hypothetical protein